ncbi:hypothetical protein [Agrococcus jejuensis]|uniref:Uncharacterized protein n=1 Tax=Agrococcus jejuensis TaxID=399736 RepID=A0A1G8EAK3_9MICO|nr:hypothetical protein [Agrococcus jejuensis]SDH66924.1 hypothetical protein SAMN04489720_1955 [Agrococcus jejuensis]
MSVDGYAAATDGSLAFFDAVETDEGDRTDSSQMRWLEKDAGSRQPRSACAG